MKMIIPPIMPAAAQHERDENAGVAVVTGAASGIGAAVCAALAREGRRVVALDRDAEALRACGAAWADAGLELVTRVLDVTEGPAVERSIADVERELGPIELAVNVAGVLRTAPVVELREQDFRYMLDTNLLGCFFLFQSVARAMTSRGRGSLIAVGSNAASTPRVNMAAYAASKAGLLAFVRCLGLELASAGIRCNVVSPGSTDTPMQRAYWSDGAAQGAREIVAGNASAFRLGIPLGRLATAEDVADAVAFLASPRARHITLHDLRVDGGASLDA